MPVAEKSTLSVKESRIRALVYPKSIINSPAINMNNLKTADNNSICSNTETTQNKSIDHRNEVNIVSPPPRKISRAAALLERVREKSKQRKICETLNPKPTLAQLKRSSQLNRIVSMATSLLL